MKIRIKSILAIMLLCIAMFTTSAGASEEVSKIVDQALVNKTFYHFNTAYDKVINMPETTEKYKYLERLTSIQSIVWTEETSKTLEMLTDLTKSSSARTYDEIEAFVTNSKLGEWDRGYLLGELTSWGRKLVWTEDYISAVDGLINIGSNITEESLANAEKLIENIKNEGNKQYLLEQIRPVRKNFDDSSNMDPVKEILKLRSDTSISRDQKVAKIISIANSKVGIEIPKEYLSGVEIYIVTDYLMQCKAPTSLRDIQQQINSAIGYYEGFKLKFHYQNRRQHIFENASGTDLNITDMLMETTGEELLPDTKVEFTVAGWRRGDPNVPAEPSEYLYVKDGQVYLRSKTIPEDGYLDNIVTLVSYKNVLGSDTGLWVQLMPLN